MGFFKSITKAISNVVKKTTDPITKAAATVIGQEKGAEPVVIAAQEAAAPAAAQANLPDKQDISTEDDSTSESAKRKLNASGKRSLSVARSSGTGINI
ncbi:TPA: hypothetical protein U5E00_003839 [Yersinia enterocolitica]|uniref:hypothetical protein n=1 Tax=Yersinia enterocolitica TaxID=630 RepID=UPI0005DBB285|nr:hypothetical protein [Yersinia enterocolitica]EKN6007987.1 phage tail protein [Yersinia enterocolitica]EKN6406620.1 phage tail protein [Yersinia enterocolitica]EMA9489939.1 hypothetical protein [Yersinia enterocolitica]CQJ56273.1 Bacteriophage T7 virion assembly protein [Yersinia enterocolitica]HDL6702880.1 hypothetical protein [Yersinia enterocolitica]